MPLQPPVDVDVTFGYDDGSLRTYLVKDFVSGPNMRVMNIKPHNGTLPPPVLAAAPVAIPHPGFPFEATVVAANALLWTGIGTELYHVGGPAALIGIGLVLLWWRQVYLRALMKNYAKQTDRPRQTS